MGKKAQLPPVSVVIRFAYSNPIPPRIVEYPDSTPDELRSLDFFRCNTANELSMWLAETFWRYQVSDGIGGLCFVLKASDDV